MLLQRLHALRRVPVRVEADRDQLHSLAERRVAREHAIESMKSRCGERATLVARQIDEGDQGDVSFLGTEQGRGLARAVQQLVLLHQGVFKDSYPGYPHEETA